MLENNIRIAIGSDHAGYELKERLKNFLINRGYLLQDFGCNSMDSMDYPDVAHPLASAVEQKEYFFGIIICGSGVGVSITANKHRYIRAALCWCEDVAELSRKHNDANVLCMPARFISYEQAIIITEKFLTTEFEGGRHKARIEKIVKF